MRPLALDLFCCQGGNAKGLHNAGFDVVGVDIDQQKRYPYPFVQGDVIRIMDHLLKGRSIVVDGMRYTLSNFKLIWASPPCQFTTALRHMHNAKQHVNFIPATRDRLKASGLPYIIENVEDAREHLIEPIMLCGSMFGLGAQGFRLERHRLFETSFPTPEIVCQHDDRPVIGVYGGHARNRSAKHGGRKTRDVWEGGHKAAMSEALGIDWMTVDGLSEAIPPAYAQWLAEAFLATQKAGELKHCAALPQQV